MRKTQIHIFYPRVFDFDGENITVGGIQNYLIGLCEVFKEKHNVQIIQVANEGFSANYKGNTILGYKANLKSSVRNQIKEIYNCHKKNILKEDVIIWGSDRLTLRVSCKNVITIQHGISFDYIPYKALKLRKIWETPIFSKVYKLMQNYKSIQDYKKAKNLVCVDYNYVNWIRTVYPRKIGANLTVIPNYGTITEKEHIIEKNTNQINILFARRFEFMRGVPILIDVIDAILPKYSNVNFTICGSGPMGNVLKNKYKNSKKVTITKYGIGESEKFNLNHHISLIPTYGSEGTSFSLLEAMSAGCVPIASNVGGMTNIILDNFNGYLVPPDASAFIKKIEYLLQNTQELLRLSKNSKETINQSFSKKNWANKWLETIDKILV